MYGTASGSNPHRFPDSVWNILCCPHCTIRLQHTTAGALCSQCETRYPYTDSGALDLRPQKPMDYSLDFELSVSNLGEDSFSFKPLSENPTPDVEFSTLKIPRHLNPELLSHLPKAATPNSLMLDIGCGNALHREVCERAGFEYVGMDLDSPDAPILGDAHALPFQDNSFDFMISIAVLEHIRFPFVMMREAYRVLKPGAKLIGTVAFLEPFHGYSFYHHTHLGTYNSLVFGGFKVMQIAPSKKSSALCAQAQMDLYPKMPSSISTFLVMPLEVLHRLWWRMGR